MNLVFTFIFIFEFIFKLLAFGIKKYFLDILNWFDALIVILSTIELILNPDFTPDINDDNNLSAFKSLRIMRTFRVLRVAKLMRHLK